MGQVHLQGLKLKYLSCNFFSGYTDISNLDCIFMRACKISYLTTLAEERILQAMSVTGKNIRRLEVGSVKSSDLLCSTLPHLTSLHKLIFEQTPLAVKHLYHLSESIRNVVDIFVSFSAQDVKSMVEWSKSRDACVYCKLFKCSISANETDICNWMLQQDGICITQCEFEAKGEFQPYDEISISWSNILSK
ncbi:hypothetical protein DPMN_043952 [Dreissena polymorpha]|uniref:Uncharacterized protein n=1 Tax=Dreissena polymorpha TaxID=45954 RepID=A0A9D4D399_DREPO|nr:hypothetical protein DPMN_043952 [Dreissena polymorpha]